MSNAYYTGKSHVGSPCDVYMTRNFVRQRDFCKDAGACFVNERKDICRQIVDPWGNIRNFPGVETSDALKEEFPSFQAEPVVHSCVRFGPFDGEKLLMVWTVRRDGREWMDHDGFGEEDYPSVRLYSFLDENGDFTEPFKLYAIGDRLYAQWAFPDDINRYRDSRGC